MDVDVDRKSGSNLGGFSPSIPPPLPCHVLRVTAREGDEKKKGKQKRKKKKGADGPACPTSRKNQILPVKLSRRGTAYPGLRSSPMTVKKALAICLDIQDRLGSVIDRCDGGV